MISTIVLWAVIGIALICGYLSFNQNSFTPLLTSIGFAVLAAVMLGRM